MLKEDTIIDKRPIAPLGLVPLESCVHLCEKIDAYLAMWRKEREEEQKTKILFTGYSKDSYILKSKIDRFGSGEAKGLFEESIRGYDLFIMVDVCNYSMTYSLHGRTNHMSPDDHYQDLKRIIAAASGKARRITVIMPFLYESRRQTKEGRESLDCAIALRELVKMGVNNIITFDAHDPRVQNAIPLHGFETVQPIYQFTKALLNNYSDLQVDANNMMIVAPDEGGMKRAIYFANMLGLDLGMFYTRRDYSTLVDGKPPVISYEFLGSDVEGKDLVIIDDMISSGNTVLEVAKVLKSKKAKRVFICATFGLFTKGLNKFDKYYESGFIDGLLTTNVIYQSPELLKKPYYTSVDMSKYIALIIDNLNHDKSISELMIPTKRIEEKLAKHKNKNK